MVYYKHIAAPQHALILYRLTYILPSGSRRVDQAKLGLLDLFFPFFPVANSFKSKYCNDYSQRAVVKPKGIETLILFCNYLFLLNGANRIWTA